MRSLVAVVVITGCAGGGDNGRHSGSGLGGSSTGGSDSSGGTVATVTPAESSGTDDDPTVASNPATSASATSDPSADSTGAADCSTAWRVEHDGALTDVTFDEASATVFAVGVDDAAGIGWALALDACDGSVRADSTIAPESASATRLDGVVISDGALYVAGSATYGEDPREGLYARLDPLDLQTVWSSELYGSDQQDEVLDIAVTASGAVWMSGTSLFDATPTAWIIAGATDGVGCGFSWGGLGSGSARAVARDGDEMVIAVAAPDGVVLARYDPACGCECTESWASMPIAIGSTTAVGDLLVVEGQYYVAGWRGAENMPDVLDAYVAWISPAGAIAGVHTGALANSGGYFVLGADADRLYIGGVEGYSAMAGFGDASAVLRAIDLPFAADPAPLWSVRPDNLDTIDGLAVEAGQDGMLYVGGNIDGGAVVVRCDKQGACG